MQTAGRRSPYTRFTRTKSWSLWSLQRCANAWMCLDDFLTNLYSQAINFLAAVDDDTVNKLEKILEDADNIQEADMTYEETVKLCLLVETRLKKLISAVTMARQLRRDTFEPAKKKPGSTDEKKTKEKNMIYAEIVASYQTPHLRAPANRKCRSLQYCLSAVSKFVVPLAFTL